MMISIIIALVLIVFIAWWFWLYQPKQQGVDASGMIDIMVDHGVYTPAMIKVKAGEEITLRFTRKTATPCAAVVVFADLNISHELPLNQAYDIHLPPLDAGEYDFTCEMGMYRGRLVVE